MNPDTICDAKYHQSRKEKKKKYSKHLILKIGILYPGSKHMTCMLCLYYEVYAAKMSERCQKHLVEFKSIPVWDQFIILIENKTKFHLLISNGDNILQNIYIFFVLKIHSDWQNNRKSCNILKCFIIQGTW